MRNSNWLVGLLAVVMIGLAFMAGSALQARPEAPPAAQDKGGSHFSYTMNVFCMNNGEGDTLQVMEKALNEKYAAKGQELVHVVPIMGQIQRKDPTGAVIYPKNCFIYYFKVQH